MKTQVLFQVLLSVCLLIATTCYGQTGYKLEDLKVEKTGYDLQGTLRISQSYDKQTKMLTLKMKNEYKQNLQNNIKMLKKYAQNTGFDFY